MHVFLAYDDKKGYQELLVMQVVGVLKVQNILRLVRRSINYNNKSLALKMRKFGGLGFTNITAFSGKVRIDKNKFQNPNWKRHNEFGFNYRMSELCAAVALAQTEKLEYFVNKRIESGKEFLKLLKKE